jgi:hypothetical protein
MAGMRQLYSEVCVFGGAGTSDAEAFEGRPGSKRLRGAGMEAEPSDLPLDRENMHYQELE